MLTVKRRIQSNQISIPELEIFFGKDVIISIEEDLEEKKLDDFFECVSNVEIDDKLIDENRELSIL